MLWHSGQIVQPPVEGVELRLASEVVAGSIIEDVYGYELQHHSHASCADLFRYQVLYMLGGAYADIDVLPDSNAAAAALLPEEPLFGEASNGTFEIRFMRTPAQHPLFLELLKRAVKNEQQYIKCGGYRRLGFKSVVDRTGPVAGWKVVLQFAKDNGLRAEDFLLGKATKDNTPENTREHHFRRTREVERHVPPVPWVPSPFPWVSHGNKKPRQQGA